MTGQENNNAGRAVPNQLREKTRAELLLHIYNSFWNNISRAEEAAWKSMASVTALYGIFLYLGNTMMTSFLAGWKYHFIFATLAAIAVFGIITSLRNNLWWARNLHLISNVEEIILKEEDFGTIIPTSFKDSGTFVNWKEVWWIHIFYYFFLLLNVVIISFVLIDWVVAGILLVGSLFIIGNQYRMTRNTWNKHTKDKDELHARLSQLRVN